MLLKITRITGMFLFVGAQAAFAQDARWKAGSIVEAHSYFFNPPWHKAKILNVGTDCADQSKPYRVKFVGEGSDVTSSNPCVGADEIRALLPAETQGDMATAADYAVRWRTRLHNELDLHGDPKR